jgi:hypothetical protein
MGFCGVVEPWCHSTLKWGILPSFTTDFNFLRLSGSNLVLFLTGPRLGFASFWDFGIWLPFGSGVLESLGRLSRALSHWKGYMTQFDSDPICEYKFLLVYLHDISATTLILNVGITLEIASTCLKFCHLNCRA